MSSALIHAIGAHGKNKAVGDNIIYSFLPDMPWAQDPKHFFSERYHKAKEEKNEDSIEERLICNHIAEDVEFRNLCKKDWNEMILKDNRKEYNIPEVMELINESCKKIAPKESAEILNKLYEKGSEEEYLAFMDNLKPLGEKQNLSDLLSGRYLTSRFMKQIIPNLNAVDKCLAKLLYNLTKEGSGFGDKMQRIIDDGAICLERNKEKAYKGLNKLWSAYDDYT